MTATTPPGPSPPPNRNESLEECDADLLLHETDHSSCVEDSPPCCEEDALHLSIDGSLLLLL